MEGQGERGGSGQGLQSNACVRALPERSGRDTVCAEERSTFRKRLCREKVEAVKQGCRRRRYACPVRSGEKTENQVHDGAESEAGAT